MCLRNGYTGSESAETGVWRIIRFGNRFGDAYIESSFRVGERGGLASCPADGVERIIAESRSWFFSRRLSPGMSQPTRIGIRIGVCFEGIQRVVDGLLDMQPFPLRRGRIHTARGARFLLVYQTPITCLLQLPSHIFTPQQFPQHLGRTPFPKNIIDRQPARSRRP